MAGLLKTSEQRIYSQRSILPEKKDKSLLKHFVRSKETSEDYEKVVSLQREQAEKYRGLKKY